MTGRYPLIEPFDQGMLDVGDGNLVYWETCGNPAGRPAVVPHGGPAFIVAVAVVFAVLPARIIARRLTAGGSRYTVTDRELIVRTRKGQEFTSSLADLRFTLWGILEAQRVRDIIAGAQATD